MLSIILLLTHSNIVYIAETYKQIMYKACTSYGIEIANDSQDKRLTHLVENVTMNNMYKASIVATFFNENENYFGNKVSHKHLSDINTITLCNSNLILNRENETVKLKLLTIKDNENPFYIPEDTRSAKTIENIIKQINEYEVYITENKVLRTRYASHKIPKH